MLRPLERADRYFLIGFMGAGKTTLGRSVAKRLGLAFHDLDERIERSSGMPVAEIFSREGEDGFRARESRALEEIVESGEPGLVATGGGAFVVESNRRLMKEAGLVVWLDLPTEQILPRIEGDARPLWTTPDEIRRLYDRRRPIYQEADIRLDLSGTDPAEGAERLYRLLTERRNVS